MPNCVCGKSGKRQHAADCLAISVGSRQLRWQRRKIAEGCCRQCGLPRGARTSTCDGCLKRAYALRTAMAAPTYQEMGTGVRNGVKGGN